LGRRRLWGFFITFFRKTLTIISNRFTRFLCISLTIPFLGIPLDTGAAPTPASRDDDPPPHARQKRHSPRDLEDQRDPIQRDPYEEHLSNHASALLQSVLADRSISRLPKGTIPYLKDVVQYILQKFHYAVGERRPIPLLTLYDLFRDAMKNWYPLLSQSVDPQASSQTKAECSTLRLRLLMEDWAQMEQAYPGKDLPALVHNHYRALFPQPLELTYQEAHAYYANAAYYSPFFKDLVVKSGFNTTIASAATRFFIRSVRQEHTHEDLLQITDLIGAYLGNNEAYFQQKYGHLAFLTEQFDAWLPRFQRPFHQIIPLIESLHLFTNPGFSRQPVDAQRRIAEDVLHIWAYHELQTPMDGDQSYFFPLVRPALALFTGFDLFTQETFPLDPLKLLVLSAWSVRSATTNQPLCPYPLDAVVELIKNYPRMLLGNESDHEGHANYLNHWGSIVQCYVDCCLSAPDPRFLPYVVVRPLYQTLGEQYVHENLWAWLKMIAASQPLETASAADSGRGESPSENHSRDEEWNPAWDEAPSLNPNPEGWFNE